MGDGTRHELVLAFRGRRVETEDELTEIEDALFELVPDGDAWDRHEVGADARRIVFDAADPALAFARFAPFLASAGLIDHVVATSRPAVGGATVTLWPRPASGSDR